MEVINDFISYFKNSSLEEQENIIYTLLELMQHNLNENLINQSPKDHKQINCPHCQSNAIQANGKNRGVQRYRCKECGKNFSETTGTPLAWLKKKDKWPHYLQCMLKGYSLRKCAEEVGISLQTSFDWRHKILSAFKTASAQRFENILESDEIFFLESEKGNKNLTRPARKRGGKASKAGINKDHVAVVVSRDRDGNADMKTATRGRISKKDLDRVFEDKIEQDTILCTDSHRSYSAFARSHELDHQKIKANKGQYVKDQVFHVQNVNNLSKRLKAWMNQFNGVSTKYLQNYLNWFLVLEKVKQSTQKVSMLAFFALSTNEAWFDFKNIAINHILFRS